MRVEKLRSSVAHIAAPSLILFGSIVVGLVALAVALSPAFLAAISPAILITVFYALHRSTQQREAECAGELSLRGDHVYVGDRVVADRSAVRSAVVIPHAREGTLVRLARRASHVDLLVHDVAEGRAAVEALRFDAAHATASFVVRSRDVDAYRKRLRWILLWVLAPVGLVLTAVALKSPVVMIAAMLAFLGMLGTALTLSASRTCVVGTDGILFGGFGDKEFIPLARVGEVEIDTIDLALGNQARVVRLYDKSGLVLREILVDALKNGPFQEGIHAAIDARAEALAERIREVQEIAATGGLVDDRALAREARAAGDWVAALRGLSRGTTTFRGGEPPTEEALLALVEDPTAPAWKRAAAAIAASARSTAHNRLRVVSAASADPHLRVALEAAAEEDEAQMAAALEELSKGSGPG